MLLKQVLLQLGGDDGGDEEEQVGVRSLCRGPGPDRRREGMRDGATGLAAGRVMLGESLETEDWLQVLEFRVHHPGQQ